jgi:uncharacterized hydrophobic protein (TIGR00271 family)
VIHIRIVAPADLVARTVAQLESIEVLTALVHLPGAGVRPRGDVILCDAPREAASMVVAALREIGVLERGSVALDGVEAAVSDDAARAEALAPGLASDAVVWESLEGRTASSAELSFSFLIYMVVATMIAALGIMTDSVILIIGAMVVGPEFGPLAGVCVGVTQRRRDLATRSLIALAVGFPLGVACAFGMVHLLIATGIASASLSGEVHPATLFISHPDGFSVVVAALAGLAGMISLTTSNPNVLIGVLISVTTIPAAGNIAVASAYGNGEAGGAAAQLGINLGVVVAVGIVTLAVQRAAFTRSLRGAVERRLLARRQRTR